MYGDCDAAIAKAAATVTHVQSLSQEVGSGDEGLAVLGFDLSSAETDFWWLEDEQTSPLIFVFRRTSYVHRGSDQARVFSMYPRRWLSLSSQAKLFTLQRRHRRFIGDSAFHTSLHGAPLLVGDTADVVSLSATSTEFDPI